ncbi:COG0488: ATPase components of ABC transporters with duplicated ATPase domains [hydrothermal vent metagenome]|uniref:COG0488: ATPase components of ABC transporters with duplicated ATPase domains n=1 Tax=hydrothermal vent metagenome TaxID=652676 RepID=A0A3B1BN69_9ZZZZ
MTGTSLLRCENLSLEAGNRCLIEHLDLDIQYRQRWAVLGMNGAGKTTLLQTLAGLLPAQQGQIYLDDQPLQQKSRREIALKLGLLFQDQHELFPGTVMETILTGRHPHLRAWQWESANDKDMARKLLAAVDLENYEQRQVNTLSGGERRRLGVATVLLQEPDLLLLDEPVNHLDLHHQQTILQLLNSTVQEKNNALLMVMHDINLSAYYCDHVLMIFKDGKTRQGSTAELLQEEILSELYQHRIRGLRHGEQTFFSSI